MKIDIPLLYEELVTLENALNPPPPDPNLWPPLGWSLHPENPDLLVQVVSEKALRDKLFGSFEKIEFLENALLRIREIKSLLIPLFFKVIKDEGVARQTKYGFVCMLKTELNRKIDVDALEQTLIECNKVAAVQEGLEMNVEDLVINYIPNLKLTEYRKLPESVRLQFDNALTVTPKPHKFEIFKQPD